MEDAEEMELSFNPIERMFYEMDILIFSAKEYAPTTHDLKRFHNSMLNIECLAQSLIGMETQSFRYMTDYESIIKPVLNDIFGRYHKKLGQIFANVTPEFRTEYTKARHAVQSKVAQEYLSSTSPAADPVDESVSILLKNPKKDNLPN